MYIKICIYSYTDLNYPFTIYELICLVSTKPPGP